MGRGSGGRHELAMSMCMYVNSMSEKACENLVRRKIAAASRTHSAAWQDGNAGARRRGEKR